MNALLLLAVLFHCSQRPTGYDACVKDTLTCAASAYGVAEAKATRILADCVTPRVKK